MKIKNCAKIFSIALFMMLVMSVPIIIQNNGYFIYMGDYNVQHINFNVHCFEILKSGLSSWDFVTGLGGDTFASYSHIMITPFFWLSSFFTSPKTVILLLPLFTAIKCGTAAVTSYIYIKKYVSTDVPAMTGAILYSFSGFQSFSFVFGSFHDITAPFPLMLIAMDEFMNNDKKVFFIVIVAFMASMNAFFFYGQAVFLIIYFVVKCYSKEYKFKIKKFLNLALSAIIGVLISGIFLFMSVKTLSSNSRVSEIINGKDLLAYSDSLLPWRIFQSLFMMPDRPGVTSLFEGENTWASISLYLPCVGIVFLYSYIKKNRKNAFSRLMILSGIIAIIPFLNSFFFMFNATFYARWFYMIILIMATATAQEIEKNDDDGILSGVKATGVCYILLAFIALLPGKVTEYQKADIFEVERESIEKIKFFNFCSDSIYFWRILGLSALMVLIIFMFLYKKVEKKQSKIFALCICGTVVLNIVYFNSAHEIGGHYSSSYASATLKEPDIPDADDEYFRINGQQKNANIIWGIPSLDDFITIAPKSVYDFYDEFEIQRTQVAYIDRRYYPINALLSVRYYLNQSTDDELNVEYSPFDATGFTKTDEQPCYHIYENQAYIPIGFTYDYCITESDIGKFVLDFEKTHSEEVKIKKEETIFDRFIDTGEYNFEEKYLQKMLLMMRALVLSDEDAEKYADILQSIPETEMSGLSEDTYYSDSQKRAESSCTLFETGKSSFKASITSEKENLVFFSIPYMEGWSAEVNGKEAEIIRANYGFMAVKIDKGDNDILFTYKNNDYKTGAFISVIGIVAFIVYMAICCAVKKQRSKNE